MAQTSLSETEKRMIEALVSRQDAMLNTTRELAAINSGQLGVVYLSGGYHLLPAARVEEVRNLSAEHVPDLGGSDDGLEDDGVPDDLVW